MIIFSSTLVLGNLTFPPVFSSPTPRLPFGSELVSWGAGAEELVFPGCPVGCPEERRARGRSGKVETLQRQMHFIDKATALYRAEAETPSGRGHTGAGISDSH